MIAFLRGIVCEKSPERLVVDVQGVGYELRVPLSTFYQVGDYFGIVPKQVLAGRTTGDRGRVRSAPHRGTPVT